MSKNSKPAYEDVEVYLPSLSERPVNAYYLRCEVVEQTTPYAACLDKIKLRKEGRLSTSYAACSAAINNGRCPSLAMRKEELKEGRALYFLNRTKMNEFYDQSRIERAAIPIRPIRQVRRIETKVEPISPVLPQHKEETNDYAAALNAAMQDVVAPKAKPFVSVTLPPVIVNTTHINKPITALKVGMSMLEIARLRMTQKVTQ